MKKRGRPPLDAEERLDARQEVRLKASEKAEWQIAATQAGFPSVSEWARHHMNRAAKRILKQP